MIGRSLVFVMVVASTAAAGPAAEKLFQDGRTFLTQGKLAEACDAFRRSNDLEPRVGTLLNLGNCEEKRGRVASAWATFVEARALANRTNDPRSGEADKRAAAVASRLPYLTVRVQGQPAGFVLKRNGADVPAAEHGHEVPLDPGSYALEAAAPGHRSWTKTVELGEGARVSVDVPVLAADPSAATTPSVPSATDTSAPVAPTGERGRRFAVGAAIGASSDGDVIGGVRGVLTLAHAGSGSIRLVPSAFYTRFGDPNDVYQHFDLFAVGLAGEYAATISRQFFIATGLGLGVDLISDAYDNPLSTHAWVAARVSPTYRLGPVDIGLHFQLVVAQSTVGLGELGIDYFF